MMCIHSSNEIDKRINVSKIANNISTMGDNSTAARCNNRLIIALVQHAHDICLAETGFRRQKPNPDVNDITQSIGICGAVDVKLEDK